ncbi:remodeling and spacing factor 1 [Microdochium nivale]|nr:remodeling and spacing factor 1 [Microdochium nivale]
MAGNKKPTPAKGKSSGSSGARSSHSRGGSTSKSSPNKRADNWNFTHIPPQAAQRTGNGRQKGRDLVSWARPRMMEQTMLHLVFECTTRNIRLPWDNIAHRLHPGLSGNALLQRFQRLRRELVAEGHLVPPLPGRGNSNTDPEVRGYTRLDRDGPDLETTRAIRFDEPWLAPQFNLPDAGRLVHNQVDRRKGGKDATSFQLGSDEDTESEEPDFDALDSDDDGGSGSNDDDDRDEKGDEDDGEQSKSAKRRAPTDRRQSIRSVKKKTYAEPDSGDEKASGKQKKYNTPDRRHRGGSSSPLVRRRDRLGRRNTASSSTQQTSRDPVSSSNVTAASQDLAADTGGVMPNPEVPITFTCNTDGSFSFQGLPVNGSGQTSTITLPQLGSSALNTSVGNNTNGLSQEAMFAMYQHMMQAQFGGNALAGQQGFQGPNNPNASFHGLPGSSQSGSGGPAGRSSIFTGQHFGGMVTPASSHPSANASIADVTMGGMGASQIAGHGNKKLDPEQHRLAMAILNPASGSGVGKTSDDAAAKTPGRRGHMKLQSPESDEGDDNIEVKTEDPGDAPVKCTPGVKKDKASAAADDMDES